jgi:hypothetical protein
VAGDEEVGREEVEEREVAWGAVDPVTRVVSAETLERAIGRWRLD